METKNPIDEQETVINILPAQISRNAEIYTCIPAMSKRLRKLAETRPDSVRIVHDNGTSVIAEVDRSCIKISPKRLVSEELRRAAADRFAAARARKVTS